jgi:hypothetical protein
MHPQKPLAVAGQGVAGRFNVTMRSTHTGFLPGLHQPQPVMYATTPDGAPYMYEVRTSTWLGSYGAVRVGVFDTCRVRARSPA